MAECKDCEYFDKNDTYGSVWDSAKKYRCKKKNGRVYSDDAYVYADDATCREFKSKGSSDCYITTIVCEILGYSDDCELLQTLRSFRDNYLKNNLNHPEYLFLLKEYDAIGPLVCNEIRKEKKNFLQCLGLMQCFLIPCVQAIKANNYDEAVSIYKNLVFHLIDTYELPRLSINMDEEVNIETLGKARTRAII